LCNEGMMDWNGWFKWRLADHGQSYNNPPATSLDALDFYNNRHQIKKTPRNAPQPTDLLFRC
jgi:hypothetical protein